MPTQRYEISLRVLKKYFSSKRGKQVKYFQHEKVAMQCSIYYLNTNVIPNHFTETVFSCERRNLLCSHSSGVIFTCEVIMFSCESSPGISLVFIIKTINLSLYTLNQFRKDAVIYLRIMHCSMKTPFLLGLPDRVSFIVHNKVIHI